MPGTESVRGFAASLSSARVRDPHWACELQPEKVKSWALSGELSCTMVIDADRTEADARAATSPEVIATTPHPEDRDLQRDKRSPVAATESHAHPSHTPGSHP